MTPSGGEKEGTVHLWYRIIVIFGMNRFTSRIREFDKVGKVAAEMQLDTAGTHSPSRMNRLVVSTLI